MADAAVDRHLLFGLLALQNGLIDQDQLLDAFRAWTRDKSGPLADHLVARGALDADQRALLEGLAAQHLKKHGGSAGASLAALAVGASTRESLANVADPDVEASLVHVGSAPAGSSGGTLVGGTLIGSVGTATSDGQRFRVLRPHAKGGLGVVSVALDAELNREVALKQILDHHADDATSRQRFVLEAEITGGLEHPGIVPVYGLGTYGDGRPYYAMRFVRGDSLKEAISAFHADEALRRDPGRRSLELRNLLRRFTDVCNAIDYAHGRGVLHRDIKPGNVIVGRHGETLVVDWGLAKAVGRAEVGAGAGERPLTPSSASGSAETLPGSAIGTPAYMSPEQAAGDHDRLGPRSDVYSLGATLYTLLTGTPPFAGDDLGAVLRSVHAGAFAPPRRLDPGIDRALEAVCLRAMALRPGDRYPTPRALAEDVERWAADEPVTAWREPLAMRARRWARRNRAWVRAGVVALLLVAVVATAAAVAINNARRHEREALSRTSAALRSERAAKAEAQENFQTARQAVQDYLTGVSENTLLKQQERADLRELRKQLLDGALKYYTGFIARHGSDPRLQSDLADAYSRVGSITEEIGSKAEALRSYERALAIRQTLVDARPGDTDSQTGLAACLMSVGQLRGETGRPDEALRLYDRARVIRQGLADAHPDSARIQNELAACLVDTGTLLGETGRTDEALRLYDRARVIRRGLAEAHPDDTRLQRLLASTLAEIANKYSQTGRPDEAVRTNQAILAIRRKLADANPGVTNLQQELATSHYNIGIGLGESGLPVESLRSFERAREILVKLAAANPSVTKFQTDLASTLMNIGVVQSNAGRPTEALPMYEQALAINQRVADANPSVTRFQIALVKVLNNLGDLQFELGKPDEARRSFEEALAINQRVADANPSVTMYQAILASLYGNLGFLQARKGGTDEALRLFGQALTIHQKLAAANPSVTRLQREVARCHFNFGDLYRGVGRVGDAVRSYEASLRVWEKLGSTTPEDLYVEACTRARVAGLSGAGRDGVSAADRAMRVLKRAVTAGLRIPARLDQQRELDPLRPRPDFQLLMMDLTFPADPFVR